LGGDPIAQGVCVLSEAFVLDDRLKADTVPVAHLAICDLLVMNDSRYPWAILVPRISGARELHELELTDRDAVWREAMTIAASIGQWPGVEKVNIGALGNVVSQLHIHIVGRHTGDPAWPGPVWGHSDRVEGVDLALLTHLERAARAAPTLEDKERS
jgi:diadenosine tetraphosphate (Ap4A) HIT family hydrolase